MTLRLLMSASGSANAVANLVSLTRRSRSTVSEHLGAAQASGWLACLQRGGYRSGGPMTSVYQATVPIEVWHRREDILAMFAGEPQQADIPVFPEGTAIPAQAHRGPTSEFSVRKINPSIPQQERPTWSAPHVGVDTPESDPVIAAVIEELAALAGQLLSPAWAARCVSQIVRHRRVRHPIAYVVKTLQNAAEDGSLVERFMPRQEPEPSTAEQPAPLPAVNEPAPMDPATLEASSGGPQATVAFEQSSITGDTDALARVGATPRVEDTPAQEIYRPGGRVLAGLGHAGAHELVKLRQQFAERRRAQIPDTAKPKVGPAFVAA
ncbi:hypothetical protein [Nocardiopsis sp. SBT366]|uniref:hypothetical protein n=1 Tax=Nocardiopsis sp. SBT366 TaxID=1580529 RepID=UPI001F44BB56|nr:hypothetical protein [Nocardiopsis sp. SBT366]